MSTSFGEREKNPRSHYGIQQPNKTYILNMHFGWMNGTKQKPTQQNKKRNTSNE